jgi:D-beta-D-heptose 7-phosphate kinase/D-beta-D-heptose 1-phosphate adenosyltransferase
MKLRPHPDATSLQAAAALFERHGGVIGMTSGTFDLLHDFHLRYLKQCRRQCDTLIVGIDSDRLVRERKGPGRPILSEWQREAVMNAIKYVEAVYVLDTLVDYTVVAEVLGVHRVFVNQAFAGREDEVAVGSSGAKVIIIPDITEHDSTSRIIARIKLAP